MILQKALKKIFVKSQEDKSTGENEIHLLALHGIIEEIYDEFKVELEDAKAQGFREAIKEMGKVKGV